jgi:hypothetical protein
MLRSFIVRVYRPPGKQARRAALRGVVEDAGRQQRSFRSLAELARILESDELGGTTTKRRRE